MAIRLLDDMPCLHILSEEITLRLVPFCARWNKNVDDMLSYYIQHELQKMGTLDDRRECCRNTLTRTTCMWRL